MRRGLALLLLPAIVWGAALAVAPGASARGKPPVVMLILDEFPTESLLGADGKIDAARYPNFARLASIATWFRNSTTVLDETTGAVPAILDARLPHRGERAELRYHPRSVYTLLGERGYRITDSEEATAICPRRYCPHAPARRPGILPNLNRGRSRRLHAWIDSIRPGRRPGFWIKHALFPHGPWLYLPSGRHTRPGVKDPVPGLGSPAGYGDRGLTGFNEQRYLLQLGYTDRELGALLDQLERTKVLDRAMVVVTADHGFSWEVGVKDRRRLTRSNIDEIGPQPLFIKAPGQRRGRVESSYVRTVDIVPTMADILGIRVNWRHDGRSAFSRTTRRRRVVRISARDFSRIISIGARELERRRQANLRRRIRAYGVGAQSKLLFGDPFAGVYRAVPHRELLGRPVAVLKLARAGRTRAAVAGAALTRSVDLRSGLLPTHIAGSVTGGRRGATRDVAVAVNGVVQSVGHTFYLAGSHTETFSVMVPEQALRQGRNAVGVFELSGRGRGLRLRPLGSN